MTDESRPVRDEDAFDVVAVEAWLGRGPIAEVRQFPGGASNLTYLLRMQEGPELILRRAPVGTKAKGAHDMGREFRIQDALKPVFPQVPTMVAHAGADDSPIAAEFYVIHVFRQAFEFLQMGYASALAWVLFVVIMGITAVQLYVSKRLVFYQGDQ